MPKIFNPSDFLPSLSLYQQHFGAHALTLKCLRWVPGDPHAGFLMFLSVYSISTILKLYEFLSGSIIYMNQEEFGTKIIRC